MAALNDILANYTGNIEEAAGYRARRQGCKMAGDVFDIELDRLVPDPDQPRKEFDPAEIEALAASLKADGQLQPIVVRYDDEANVYIVICGERRLRAAILAELPALKAVLQSREDPEDRRTVQLIENSLRAKLTYSERAKAYKALMDAKGWGPTALAERLQLDQSTVSATLRLLELPPDVLERVDAGELPFRKALDMLRATTPKRKRKPVKPKTTCRKITVGAAVVTIKHRPGDDLAAILRAALEQVEPKRKAA